MAADKPKTPVEIVQGLTPRDLDAMRVAATELIELLGDLPEHLLYSLGYVQDDPIAAWRELESMRPEGSTPHDFRDMI